MKRLLPIEICGIEATNMSSTIPPGVALYDVIVAASPTVSVIIPTF